MEGKRKMDMPAFFEFFPIRRLEAINFCAKGELNQELRKILVNPSYHCLSYFPGSSRNVGSSAFFYDQASY